MVVVVVDTHPNNKAHLAHQTIKPIWPQLNPQLQPAAVPAVADFVRALALLLQSILQAVVHAVVLFVDGPSALQDPAEQSQCTPFAC